MNTQRNIALLLEKFRRSETENILLLPFDTPKTNFCRFWRMLFWLEPLRMLRNIIILAIATPLFASNFKNVLLRLTGMRIGKNVFIATGAFLDHEYPELISIGDNVIIGIGCRILTHEMTHTHVRLSKVHIGDDALIGAFATIRSGVRVHEGAVVAMDALVTEDIPDLTLVTSMPRRIVHHLSCLL